jgi:chorismate synthase
MAGNSFGNIFRLTSFGESHGAAIGGVIDGCPAGLEIDEAFIQKELDRRKPGQSSITTPRNEDDKVEFLSGIFEGKTTGTPVAFVIRNKDAESKDYSHLRNSFRPGHADFTFEKKFGIRDYRGGGRSSARETISRVVAGSVAKLFLKQNNIHINAFVKQVGNVATEKNYSELNFSSEENIVRCPDKDIAEKMISLIEEMKHKGDSLGGVIQCVIENVPVGLGEPVFDKLHARLAYAMMGINAVKGFEIGEGFNSVQLTGSEMNDVFVNSEKGITTKTNHSGGIQGGISNGNDVYFNLAFKPVSTVMQSQKSVNTSGEEVVLEGRGRHDPCVLPRAVPIVESMAAIVIADFLLLSRSNKI